MSNGGTHTGEARERTVRHNDEVERSNWWGILILVVVVALIFSALGRWVFPAVANTAENLTPNAPSTTGNVSVSNPNQPNNPPTISQLQGQVTQLTQEKAQLLQEYQNAQASYNGALEEAKKNIREEYLNDFEAMEKRHEKEVREFERKIDQLQIKLSILKQKVVTVAPSITNTVTVKNEFGQPPVVQIHSVGVPTPVAYCR